MGVILFLFTSFGGFVIPYVAGLNLGRSVHALSGLHRRVILGDAADVANAQTRKGSIKSRVLVSIID
jgi:hypothetical protein